jgi:dephospho-CoA kinase
MKKLLENKNRLVIGLTGSFGTGKTTVAGLLREKGCKVVDADSIGHDLLKSGTTVYKKIAAYFGNAVLDKEKAIDRRALSHIVFADDEKLKALNAIIHPEIIKKIKSEISKVRKGVVVLDAPLLLEAGLQGLTDKIIVVTATRANQIKRVQARLRLSKSAINRRLRIQMPLGDKVRMADFIIDNNGSLSDLKKQVEEIRRKWWTS